MCARTQDNEALRAHALALADYKARDEERMQSLEELREKIDAAVRRCGAP